MTIYLIWGATQYEGERLIAAVSSLEQARQAVDTLNETYEKHMQKVRTAIEKDRNLPEWPLKDISEDEIYSYSEMVVDWLPASLRRRLKR